MSTKWLRRKHMCLRYGVRAGVTIDRWVKAGRLPPPQFPFQNSVPAWNEAELDEHDRAVVAGRAGKRSPSSDESAASNIEAA